MKTLVILIIMLTTCSLSNNCQAKTEIHLFDFSGSLTECQPLLAKNLGVVNLAIESLGKNDHFLFYGYRSQGRPILLAEMVLPDRLGPRGRDITRARDNLRRLIKESLSDLDRLLQNSGGDTDIVGALNHILIYCGDLSSDGQPIELHLYSDGIQTARVGSYKVAKSGDYLTRLERQLPREQLVKPVLLTKLTWHGGVCLESMKLSLQESAILQSTIRSLWADFLARETPQLGLNYLLNY